jgi:hypothetical protein
MGKGQFREESAGALIPGENGPRRRTYKEVSRRRGGLSRLSSSPDRFLDYGSVSNVFEEDRWYIAIRFFPATIVSAPLVLDAHRLSALLREELESLLDELLVELEDAGVAGVRVDHQLVIRQTSGHVERVRRRQHPVVIAVREEHGLLDE